MLNTTTGEASSSGEWRHAGVGMYARLATYTHLYVHVRVHVHVQEHAVFYAAKTYSYSTNLIHVHVLRMYVNDNGMSLQWHNWF